VINRLALTCGLALMDTCSLLPWSLLLGVWGEPGRQTALLSAPGILAVLLLSAAATHVLGRRAHANPRTTRLMLAALALLVAALTVRLEHYPEGDALAWIPQLLGALAATLGQLSLPVLGFALSLYLFWRGVRLGGQTPGFVEVEGAFRWGTARLAVCALIMVLTSRPGLLRVLEAATTPYVVGYFFVSLLTLALARLESLRTRTRAPSLNRQWLGVLVVVAAGVVLLALLLGQLVSFDVLLVASQPLFDLLGGVLLLVLYAIFIPLAYVIEWLIYLVLSLVRVNGNRPPPQPPEPNDIQNALQRFFAEQVPPELLLVLKALGAALLIGLALMVVARGLSRWRPSGADTDASNEERDSLWRADQAWAKLLAWLRRILRRDAVEALGTSTESGSTAEPTPVAPLGSVRELYARLLRAGESTGVRRGVATTPLEHLPALEGALVPEEALAQLTGAYVRVRYGDTAIGESETAALADELRRVHAKGATQ
jgi:uncharacterized protein DUF4129